MSSDFFKELSSITGENIPSAENLSTEQKAALAAHYRNTVGWTVKQVGEHLGCNPSYVYRLLQMDTNDMVSEMECRTYLDNFAIHKKKLEDEIAYQKRFRDTLRKGYKQNQDKDDDGNYVDDGKSGSPRDHSDVSRLIEKLESNLRRFEQEVGTLTIGGNKNIYGSLQDSKLEDEDTSMLDMNDLEIQKIFLAKLAGATHSVKPQKLSDVKDEPILKHDGLQEKIL